MNKARHPWLRRFGWLVLLVVLALAGVFARYALQRREHFKLREAEAMRAPVVSPRRSKSIVVAPTTAPDAVACVRGRVVDHGAPVAGMLVSAASTPPTLSGACPCTAEKLACACREGLDLVATQPRAGLLEAVKSATTDAKGEFALCGLEGKPGALPVLWAEHVDGRLALPGRLLAETSSPSEFLELQVVPLIAVEGVVLSNQAAVAGATVHAFTVPAVSVRTFTTDARGRFSARLPANVGSFVVAAPKRAPQRLEQGFAPNQVLVLRLQAPASLTVRALEGGKPVAGAAVRVGDESPVETDAQGLARFSLAASRYRVRGVKGELTGSMGVLLLEDKPLQVDLLLEPGVRVRGVVRDEQGRVQPGARVRGLGGQAALITDAQGRFESEPVARGLDVSPVASVDGCADSKYRSVDAGDEELELVVACTETVNGVVVDAEGKPIAGASVFLEGGGNGESAFTDATGTFRFHAPPGAVQLKVRHDDYRLHAQPLIVPAKDVTVVLDAGGSISGRVVDGKGAGIAAADVTVVPAVLDQLMNELEESNTHAVTDAEGNFHLSGLSAGRLAVSATADNRGVVVSDVVVLQPGEHREGVTLTLDEGVDLRGTVHDEQQRPIAGARVRWDPADEKATLVSLFVDAVRGRVDEVLRYMPSPSFSDADGHFEVRGLPLSKVKMSISAQGYEEAEQLASRGDAIDVVLKQREVRLSGRVVDEAGRPVTRFVIDGATLTPEDGRFEVRLSGGAHVLRIRAPGFSDFRQEYKLDAPTKDVGDVVLHPARSLVVEVKGADGAPLERVDVRATQGEGGGDSCRTTREGRCTLDALSAEKALLAVRKEGFVPFDQPLEAAQLTGVVPVTLTVAAGKLAGQVFAVPGRPGIARSVYLAGKVNRAVVTDAEGRFTAEGLPEGRYCVTLDGVGMRAAEWGVPAEASATPTPVQLGPVANGATVTGRKTLPGRLLLARDSAGTLGGRAVSEASATTACDTLQTAVITLVTMGEFRVEGVPPGRWAAYFVDVSEADEKAEVKPVVLELLPGETKSLP